MSKKEMQEEKQNLSEETITNDVENTNTTLNVEDCKNIICPTCTVQKDADDTRLRAMAEMENFKKRLQKEKDEQMAYAAESVLADLLPTLDNLDLAIQYGSKDEACKDTIMGVEMTKKLLLDVIKKHGLEPIGNQGEPFNPEFHEAIAQEDHQEIPAGHIINVMQKGYVLKGRLLRSAKVTVCKTQNSARINTTI